MARAATASRAVIYWHPSPERREPVARLGQLSSAVRSVLFFYHYQAMLSGACSQNLVRELKPHRDAGHQLFQASLYLVKVPPR